MRAKKIDHRNSFGDISLAASKIDEEIKQLGWEAAMAELANYGASWQEQILALLATVDQRAESCLTVGKVVGGDNGYLEFSEAS